MTALTQNYLSHVFSVERPLNITSDNRLKPKSKRVRGHVSSRGWVSLILRDV